MGVSIPPAVIITIMAVAIGLALVLVAFGNRLPERMRVWLEWLVAIGYPAAIGIFFVVLGIDRYLDGEMIPSAGFGGGALIMLLLTLRAIKRHGRR